MNGISYFFKKKKLQCVSKEGKNWVGEVGLGVFNPFLLCCFFPFKLHLFESTISSLCGGRGDASTIKYLNVFSMQGKE